MRLLQLKFLYYSRLCDVVKIVVKVVSTLYIFIRYSMRLKIFTVLNNPRRTAKLFQVKVQLNFRDIWRLPVHNWLAYASLILMQCLRAHNCTIAPPPGENFYDLISLPTILWQMAGKCWLLKSHQISHELKQGTPVLQILCLLQLWKGFSIMLTLTHQKQGHCRLAIPIYGLLYLLINKVCRAF